jgi:hypothetical protein
MIVYMMMGILAVLAFLCVSRAIPEMLQRQRSRASSSRRDKVTAPAETGSSSI